MTSYGRHIENILPGYRTDMVIFLSKCTCEMLFCSDEFDDKTSITTDTDMKYQ